MNKTTIETTKTTTRVAILGAVGTVLAYLLGRYTPEVPMSVRTAVISLVLVAVDAGIHHSKLKLQGLVPF